MAERKKSGGRGSKFTGKSKGKSGRIGSATRQRMPLRAAVATAIAGVTSLLAMSKAHAGTYTWSGLGTGTANWNTPNNWTPNVVPGTASTDEAVFNTLGTGTFGYYADSDLNAPLTLGQVYFSTTTADGYTISAGNGSTLSLTSTGTTARAIAAANTTGTNTISAPLNFNNTAASTFVIAQKSGGTLNITGIISDTNSATLEIGSSSSTDNGLVDFSNTANTFTGNVLIGAGALAISGDQSLGADTNPVSLTPTGGGTVELILNGNFTNFGHALTFNAASGLSLGVGTGFTASLPAASYNYSGTNDPFTFGNSVNSTTIGTLNFTTSNQFGTGGLLTVDSGSINLNGNNLTVSGIAFNNVATIDSVIDTAAATTPSTISIGSLGITGAQAGGYPVLGSTGDTILLTASQSWNQLETTAGRSLTINGKVLGSATAGNTTDLSLMTTNAAQLILTAPISDGTFGGNLAVQKVLPGVVNAPGIPVDFFESSSTYTGGTYVDAGILSTGTFAATEAFGTGPIYIGSGILRLNAISNYVSSNIPSGSFYVGPTGGIGEVQHDIFGLTGSTVGDLPISSTSSGFLLIDGELTQSGSMNLAAYGNGYMWLGCSGLFDTNHNGVSTYNAASLGAGAGNVYRLGVGGGTFGGVGTLAFTTANTLSGSASVVVGSPLSNAPDVFGFGEVQIHTSMSYTGGTTVNRNSALDVGSFNVTSGTSPLGSTTTAVTLNSGKLVFEGIPLLTTGYNIGTLNFSGDANLVVNVTSPSNTTSLTAASLTRQNSGILQISATGTSNTLGTTSQVFVTSAPATTGINNGANSMVAPYLLDGSGTFLTYSSGIGFTDAVAGATTVGAAANSQQYLVKTAAADATVTTKSIYALDDASGAVTAAAGTFPTLTIDGGGLTITNNIGTLSTANFGIDFTTAEGFIYTAAGGTIYAPIANTGGTAGITKSGNSTLALNPYSLTATPAQTSNTFTGPITINAGTLEVASDAALGNPSNGVTINGGVFQFYSSSVATSAAQATTSRTITLGGNGATIEATPGANSVTSTFNGQITGTTPYLAIINQGGAAGNPNAVTILGNASNNFTGPIFIDSTSATGTAFNPTTNIVQISADGDLGNASNTVYLQGGNVTLQTTSSFATSANRGFILNALGGNIDVENNALAVNGPISGDGNLTLLSSGAGGGTLILAGTNTYYGGTTISAGALQVGAGTTSGQLGAGSVINNSSLLFNVSGSYAASNYISGTGSVTVNGTGTITLSGANIYAGGTTINSGVLLAANAAGSSVGSGSVTVNGGAFGAVGTISGVTLNNNSTFAPGGGGQVAVGTLNTATATFTAGAAQTLNFRLGASSVTNDVLNVTATNGLTLNTTNSDMTINIAPTGLVSNGYYRLIDYVGSVGGLGSSTLASYLGGINLNDGRIIGTLVPDPNTLSIDLDVTGSDTIHWTGQDNVSGSIDPNWNINTSYNWQQIMRPLAGGTNYLQPTGLLGDVVTFDDSATGTTTVNVSTNLTPASVTFNNSADPYIFNGAGTISGTGTLTKNGTNSVTFNQSNNYSGLTTINAGTIIVGATGALGSPGYVIGNAGFVVNGALTGTPTISLTGGTATFNSNVALGTVTLTGGTASFNGNTSVPYLSSDAASSLYNAGVLTTSIGTGVTSDLAGALSGPGSLTLSGNGTLELAGSNSFAGNTTLSSGTLLVGNASALSKSTVVFNGGALNIGSLSPTLGGLSGSTALNIPNTGQTVTIGNNNGSNSFTGAITGSGNLATTGSGTITLGGAWPTSGAVGSLTVGGTGTVILTSTRTGNLTPITVSSGATLFLATGAGDHVLGENLVPDLIPLTLNGTLDLNGDSVGFSSSVGPWGGGLQGAGTLTSSNTGTLASYDNFSDNPETFSGTISGDLRFIRRGNSAGAVFTLSGNNSYAGQTEIRGMGTFSTESSGNYGSTIAVSSDSNLGSPTVNAVDAAYFGYVQGGPNVVWLGNNVLNNAGRGSGYQGTLEVTGASFATNRQFLLDAGGGAIQVDNASTVFTINGPLTIASTNAFGNYNVNNGSYTSGSFTKTGPGTLVLDNTDTYAEANTGVVTTGQDDYTGATYITDGTLNVDSVLTNTPGITVDATNYSANLVLSAVNAAPSDPITGIAGTSTLPTITVDIDQNLATLTSPGTANFASGNSTVSNIVGGGTLLVGASGTLAVSGGIAQTEILSNGTLNISGASINVIGTGNGVGAGTGTVNIGGIDGAGTLGVTGGSSLVAAHLRQGFLSIDSTSSVTIADSSTPGNTAATSILTDISNAGTLDLNNNDLIVKDTTQYSTVKSLIVNAYDSGAWDQPGITSSSARANSGAYGLGYAQASTIGSTTFDGQTFTDAVLVKYTLLGDSQLRGTVGIGDYDTVLSNYGTAQDWSGGNFHYGGVVGIGDYDAVLSNYGAHASGNLAVGPSLTRSINPAQVTPSLSINPDLAKTDLKLEVNAATGDVYVLATASTAFTGYTISDPTAHLLGGSTSPDPDKLLSVAAQSGGNTNVYETSGTYVDWFKITETASQVAEGQQQNGFGTHSSRDDTINIPAGGTIDFGDIYNTAAAQQDLTFDFAEAGTEPTNGPTYYGAEVDYISSSTPEPASVSLLAVGAVGMLSRRKRRKPCLG